MTTTIILGIVMIGLFFALMSVRLIFVKNGQFKGTCASQSPFLNKEGEKCSFCGKEPGEQCKNQEPDNEVDKVLSKFS
ncbi:hypothetical protein [Fulvitalea axinellae]